ncbi:hypothetical protein B0H16DRAFT_1751805 [Mycena metata]|uniref:Uncharacterized protein n=1 Tax=Mycena metata TaxID=1033252 RepID=A0AAD7DJE5_9AGAR|nr:hypothetical protein B0H16DRAFT_1751805 [Mycena metata]
MSSSSTFRRVWSQQDLLVTEVDAVLGQQTRRRVGLLWSRASGVQRPKGEVAQLFAGLFPPPPRRAQVPASANASSQTLPPPSPTTLPRTGGTVSVPEDAAVVLANAAAALIPVVASVVRDALGAPHMWCSRRHPYNAVLANAARKRCHPRSPTTPRTAVLSNPSATATSGSQLLSTPARSHAHCALERKRRRTHRTQTLPPPRPASAFVRPAAPRPCNLARTTGGTLHCAYPPCTPQPNDCPRPVWVQDSGGSFTSYIFFSFTAFTWLTRQLGPTPYPIAPPAAPRPCTHAHRRRRIHTPPPRPLLHYQPPLDLAHTRTAVAAYAHHPRVRVCQTPAALDLCTHKTSRERACNQTYPKSLPLRDPHPEKPPSLRAGSRARRTYADSDERRAQ